MKIRANVSKIHDENSHVKAYADITVENCCRFNGIRVVEGKEGELFVSYPQKKVYEHGQPKLDENGKQTYTDIYYGNSKEANDAIKALVLEAYHSEKGYAYLNPKEGEFVNAKIEHQLHACNGDSVKAAGSLTVGGYMRVKDIFVHLRTDGKGDQFLSVSYPHYKSGDDFKDFVEPLEKGKMWDSKEKVEKDYNFKRAVEGAMKKQTREFHPELAHLADGKVSDLIADAKESTKDDAGQGKAEPEREAVM